MHPWSAVAWAWRVLRGHSVVFAALFACGVLGISVIAAFRDLLSTLGAPWYAWLLTPFIAVALLARKETEWMPELQTRKKWARRIFFGAILIAVAMAFLRPARPPEKTSPAPMRPRFHK